MNIAELLLSWRETETTRQVLLVTQELISPESPQFVRSFS